MRILDEWPKIDPMTGRAICSNCWNGLHRIHNVDGELKDGCNHPDCDCVHLSEKTFADIERKTIRDARKAKRKLEREALESESNPLRAENPHFQKKFTGKKEHA